MTILIRYAQLFNDYLGNGRRCIDD